MKQSKYRQMRVLVMYDLPMSDYEQNREYTIFRKELIRQGFYKIQFSIYCKVIPNKNYLDTFYRKIKKVLPEKGEIRILTITEKQYENMKFLRGSKSKYEEIVGDNRIVYIDRGIDE